MISVGLLAVQDSCYIALSVSFVVDIYIVSSSHVVILLSKTYPQCKIISFGQSLPSYKFICGNICSSDLVNYAFQEEEIDIYRRALRCTDPRRQLFWKLFPVQTKQHYGTYVLFESAKIAGIKRFIHVSTDEVYGEQTLDQAAMHDAWTRSRYVPSTSWELTISPNILCLSTLDNNTTIFSLSPEDV
jgi:dTDP-D-glucose 4,6-dehydratase